MKKHTIESIKLSAEVVAVLISLIALFVSLDSSRRANNIAELSARPQVVPLNTFRLNPSPYEFANTLRITCNNRIRVANVGGADTTLESMTIAVLLGNDRTSFEVDDVSGSGDLVDDILYTGYLPGRYGSPIVLPAHSTIDFESTLEVEAAKDKHSLTLDYAYPESPSHQNGPVRELWIEYTLHFPDADSVTAPLVFCTHVGPP